MFCVCRAPRQNDNQLTTDKQTNVVRFEHFYRDVIEMLKCKSHDDLPERERNLTSKRENEEARREL